jgi:hypothetical protein
LRISAAYLSAAGQLGKDHRQDGQRIERERNGHDAVGEGQHGDVAFGQQGGEEALGQHAALLGPGGEQYRGEGHGEGTARGLLEGHRTLAEIAQPPMLDDDQQYLGQQHADEQGDAARLQDDDGQDGAQVEHQRPGHWQDEDAVQVEQRALAIKDGLHADQQGTDGKDQLAGLDLLVAPTRGQGMHQPGTGEDTDHRQQETEQADAPVQPATDLLVLGIAAVTDALQIGNHGIAQGEAEEAFEEHRQDEGDKDQVGFPAHAELPGDQQVAQESQQEAGDGDGQDDQGRTHARTSVDPGRPRAAISGRIKMAGMGGLVP